MTGAGFGSNTTDTATTPSRKTHVDFDVDEEVAQQEAYADCRFADQMQADYDLSVDDSTLSISALTTFNVERIKGVGWELKMLHGDGNQPHEQGAATKTLNVPSGYENQPTWSETDQAGATYAGAPAVTPTGDLFYTKKFTANSTLADAAYQVTDSIGAPPSGTNAPLYCVGIDPGGSVLEDVMISFRVPGSSKHSPDYIGGFGFNGPLGWMPNPDQVTSSGYYWVGFRGNGRGELWVYLSNQKWRKVRTFTYCAVDQVIGRTHRILIAPRIGRFLNVSGGSILIRCSLAPVRPAQPDSGAFRGILSVGQPESDAVDSPFQLKWDAPGIYTGGGAANAPQRVHVRQDLPVQFQVAKIQYVAGGVLMLHPFTLDFIPDDSTDFQVFFQASIPSGCQLICNMYAVTPQTGSTDSAYDLLASTGTVSGSLFTPIAGTTNYALRFVFEGESWPNVSNTTPELFGYQIIRDGVLAVVSPGTFSPAFAPPASPPKLRTSYAQHLAVTLADNNPATAEASLLIDDVAGDCEGLQQRGDFPTEISTDFVDATGSHNVIWHRGYSVMPSSQQLGNHDGGWRPGFDEQGVPTQQFNYEYRFKAQVRITGAWQRLQEQVLTGRLNLAQQFSSADGPPKVTDILRTLFHCAGYGDNMLYIADNPVLIFPINEADGLVLDPQSNISEVIVRLVRDYLGGYLYFEPNLGSYGVWMVLFPVISPIPAASFLFAFTPASPGANKVQHSLESYGTATLNGVAIQQAPMYKFQTRWKVVPPEGNIIVSYGVTPATISQDPTMIEMIAYNVNSFDFGFNGIGAPSPANNPDWLARPRKIYQYLPAYANFNLGDGSSPVAWATRRVYDVSCHGRLQFSFMAPAMIVKDTTTIPGTTFYRPLRFYDPVYVMGRECIVRSAELRYDKDAHQFGHYTVEQVIGTGIVQATRLTPKTASWRAAKQNAGYAQSLLVDSPRQYNIEKRMYGAEADCRSFASLPVGPLQNADGSFPFMLDYDPIG